jgi:hypothetical protein
MCRKEEEGGKQYGCFVGKRKKADNVSGWTG